MGAYYVPFTGESLGGGGDLDRPSLPLPQIRARSATSDPNLGEMFADATRAAGRRFYPPPEAGTVTAVEPSYINPISGAQTEQQNNWPSEPQVARRHVSVGNKAVW
jgi:hypothetical protein